MSGMESLQKIIRKAIDEGRVTISGLARTVGCSRQQVHHILNGSHGTTLNLAEKLAKACGAQLTITQRRGNDAA